jgi:hypothetical protein
MSKCRFSGKAAKFWTLNPRKVVGVPRFELGTPCTPCKCATRLRHTPTVGADDIKPAGGWPASPGGLGPVFRPCPLAES